MGQFKQAIINVFTNKRSLSIALITAVVTFTILYWIEDIENLFLMNSPSFAYFTFFLYGVIAVLFGLNLALVVNAFAVKSSATAGSGFVLSAIAAGCPVCQSGVLFSLLPFLGISGAVFPLKGLEFKFLSIGILLLSVYLSSRSCTKCKAK